MSKELEALENINYLFSLEEIAGEDYDVLKNAINEYTNYKAIEKLNCPLGDIVTNALENGIKLGKRGRR